MDRRSLGYSALLLFGLVIASVLLNRGLIQGLHADADVDITRDASTYLLGQTIVFNGTLTFRVGEATSSISQVRLVTSGPQPLSVILPVEPTAGTLEDTTGDGFADLSDLTTSTEDILRVKVEFSPTLATVPGGTLPNGSLPATLPGTIPGTTLLRSLLVGGVFKAVSGVETITYEIHWTPGVFRDPPPTFTLISNSSPSQTDVEFAIPTLAGAAAVTGTQLPAADLKFTIPTVGEPTGTKLPAVTSTVAIPDIQSLISTNAPSAVPALRDITFNNGGFAIPQVSVATSSVNSFPDSSAGFNIQAVTVVTAPSGVPNLPEVAQHSSSALAAAPRGIATDGTDFWIISDNSATGADSGKDRILRFASDLSATGTPIIAPSSNIEAIAFLDDSLWVVDGDSHCGDDINPVCQNKNHFIFEVPIASPPASGDPADWSGFSRVFAPDSFANITGITVDGSGSAGTLWLARSDGFEFYNITQSGTSLDTVFTSGGVSGVDSFALSGEFLYSSKGSTVTQWTKTGTKVQDFSIVNETGGAPISSISGMTFKPVGGKQVLFVGSSADNKVYKGFFAESVTTNPVAMAFSPATASVGEAVWMVLDGTPKDKIVKVDKGSGSFKTFGTNGAADAPNSSIDGMTFLSGFLWLVSNEPGQFGDKTRRLHKVSATNGAEQGTATDLNALGINDDIGAITNDETNLVLHSKSNFNQTWVVNTAGEKISQTNPCCPEPSFQGANAIAFNTVREQYFVAQGGTIARYDSSKRFVREDQITQTSGTPPTGIQALTFDGLTLFIGHSGKVSKSFLASTVSTTPRGVAFTSATTTSFGTALYILVDATPVDKILKVDPSDGSIITTGQFGTNGVADAPTDKTTGIVFLNDLLWVSGSEGSGFDSVNKVYQISPSTGVVNTSFNISFFEPIGGIATDGTDLLLFFEPFNEVLKVDTSGTDLGFTNPQSQQVFGATALTRHVARNVFLAAKNDKLLTLKSDLQSVVSEKTFRLDSSTFNGQVQGMAFNQDILYVAYTESGAGRVALGALKDTATTDPRGLAFSPTGSTLLGASIGEALWAIVDANPKDKILKLNPATGALITSTNFPSSSNDAGFTDAPSNDIAGVTFLDGFLWMISNEQSQFGDNRRLYKVKATDGSVADTFNVSQNIFDNATGITNDGTNLIVFTTNTDQVITFNQNGNFVSQQFADNLNGASGAAFRSGASELLTISGSQVLQFGVGQNGFDFVAQFNVSSISGAQGLAFDTGSANDLTDDVLYIAHKDSVGRISRTAVPSGVTNDPSGLAYDSGANELYILVAGKGNAPAHVVVLDPNPTSTPPAVTRDFDVPKGEANGITFLNGSLYVSLTQFTQGGPQIDIVRVSPTDGTELARFGVNFLDGDSVPGLSNNGTDLLVVPEFGRPRVAVLDSSGGNELSSVELFDPGFFFDVQEMQALAFFASSTQYFPVKGTDVFQFDEEGELIDEFSVTSASSSPFGNIKGAVFVGNVLYLAEGAASTVHTTKVPAQASVVSNDPLGMDIDVSGSLYIAVDFGPEDKLMKLSSSTAPNLDTSFGDQGSIDLGSAEVESVAVHGDSVYVISNELETFEEEGFFVQFTVPIVRKFDKDTGAETGEFGISVQGNPGFPPFGCGFGVAPGPNCRVISQTTIGALASDGQFLYAGGLQLENGAGIWLKLDIDNPTNLFGHFPVVNAEVVIEDEGLLPLMAGFDAMQVVTGPQFPTNRQLLGANGDTIARFDRDTGVMFRENSAAAVVDGQFQLSGTDIKGLAYASSTRKLFIADNASDSILSTTLPENTGIELTIVGNYTSQLLVFVDSTSVQDTTAGYAIQRNPQVFVDLQSPTDNFVLTQASTTISGRINDPSIKTTTVGITLPFAKFVDDPVTPGVSENVWIASGGSANWHIACQDGTPNGFPGPDRFSSASCSWRYGTPGAQGFGINQTTQGSLTLKTANAVTASNDTQLKFTTGYDTEVSEDIDQKIVEVAQVTTDPQGNDAPGTFRAVAQIVLSSQGGAIPKPANFHPSFKFIELDPLFVNPSLVPVTIDLSAFAGQRIVIRFNFDSVDDFANEGEGWYLDDIEVSGSGVKTIQIATTPLDPPVSGTVNGTSTTFFRSFTAQFTLFEGFNTIGASARQPYGPFLSDLRTASGFVDTIAPLVSLFGLPAATNVLGQTLSGSIVEPTLQLLTIVQTAPDGSTSTIFSLNQVPQGGTFSVGVSLKEGTNRFDVNALDGGGLTATSSAQSIGDLTAPTAQVVVVTVTSEGEAVVGDQYFVLVAATDSLSGVGAGTLVSTGQTIPPVSQTPSILVEMHGLGAVGNVSTTHVTLAQVEQNTPVGLNTIPVTVSDLAGNTTTVNGSLSVVAARTNRNYFLFPGNNFMGLALIPDDGNPATTDDASLDRLMTQDVTGRVSQAFFDQLATSSVTLGDMVESTFAFNKAGNFVVHTPGVGAADTLTDLQPFQGVILKTKETSQATTTVDVFKKGSVEGFTALQAVPIRINIQGVFSPSGATLPPSKEMRVGFNLIAPHILNNSLFDTVYRGALIPRELAVSALTFERRVDAISGTGITAEIFEGFVSNSLGDLLKPVLSYWTFIVDDPQNILVNEFGDQLGPTIVP